MRFISLVILLLCNFYSSAFSIRGSVTDVNGEQLPYTNIYIKGTTNGTSANMQGQYLFEVPAGNYELVFQHIGYKQKIVAVNVTGNTELNVVLEETEYEIKDVVIDGKEDPALAVIRKAIEKRKYFLNAVESYSCDAYIKGVQRITDAPFWARTRIKNAGLTVGKDGVIYLSESQSKLYYKKPGKFHEVIYSSRVSGKANGFTFNTAQNFYFNFYERNIEIPFIAQRPFISPLSENTFFYYNFKMLGAYREGDRLINKILVTPKRKSDPCFSGILSIVEDNWNIHSLELYLTKNSGIQYLDTLKVTQYFVPVKNDLWLPTQQRYDANGGVLGIKGDGYYLGIFRNYEVNDLQSMSAKPIKIDSTKSQKKIQQQVKKAEKQIEKKVFTPEIIKVEAEANQREEAYWDSIRPVPLTELETGDYQLKDSIEKVKDTREYKDSTDRTINKPTFFSVLTGYTFRKQYHKLQIEFPSPLNIVNFNTLEGVNFQLRFGIRKAFGTQRRIAFEPVFRYGLTNRSFNSMATLTYLNSQKNGERFTLEGGKYISQMDETQPQPEFGNTWLTLLLGRNFMKLYEHYFVKFAYERELYNGIRAKLTTSYSQRFPMENIHVYSFFEKTKTNLTPNGVDLPWVNYANDNISRHNNFRVDLRFNFVFGQKYITRPDMKFRTGSPYPELDIIFKRAIPIKGFSDLDYDYLEARLYGSIPLKILGTMQYRFGGGGFASRKRVEYADFKHFSGNFFEQGGTDLLGFYTIRYYRHSTDRFFAEAHIEQHFGGFLFNKIPGLRTLKLDEIIGFHFLYTPTRQQYFQLDVGIGNILKLLRIDFVAGFESNKVYHYSVRAAINMNLVR